ncbi:MAG: YidC/Oxa1 family membrane protein insertase [Actinobacteria bacterium]|nr:YidC/Oxa1 family membrane protein insertase [Actinomycetota bacterium]
MGAVHRGRRGRRPRRTPAARGARRPAGARVGPGPAAAARAHPALPRPPGRREPAGPRRGPAADRRRARVPRLGLLPLLVQLPLWAALYHLVAQAAAGVPVGAMDAALVASLGAATVLGVPLAERGYLGAGWAHLIVVAGLAGTAALLSWVTQTYLVAPNTVLADVPEAVARVQHLVPALSALGLLVAAGFAPVALLVYWVCNALWTLAQQAVVTRWFPTPGSPAAARAAGR